MNKLAALSLLMVGCSNTVTLSSKFCSPLNPNTSLNQAEEHLNKCLQKVGTNPNEEGLVISPEGFSEASQEAKETLAVLKHGEITELPPLATDYLNESLGELKQYLRERGDI